MPDNEEQMASFEEGLDPKQREIYRAEIARGLAEIALLPMKMPPMSLRDYFAGQAIICALADSSLHQEDVPAIAGAAYLLADAMLAERRKDKPPAAEAHVAIVQPEDDDSYRRRLLQMVGEGSTNHEKIKTAAGAKLDEIGSFYEGGDRRSAAGA